jgi:Protein of unknown function (DUF3108)
LRKVSWLALLTLILVPGAARAQTERLLAGYEIAWQGLEIAAFEADLATEPERYQLSYRARTTGLLGWLFPFVSEGSSEGARSAAQAMPQRYRAGSTRRDESRSWAVTFDTDGRAIEIELPQQDLADREPVPEELRVAPDPLALMLGAIGRAAPGVRLTGMSFDGKRAVRYELACAQELAPVPDKPPAAAAAGQDALACTVDGELAAGASRRWGKRSMRNEERDPATVWLARGLAGSGFWPVLVEAQTRYGEVTARLVSLEPGWDVPSN